CPSARGHGQRGDTFRRRDEVDDRPARAPRGRVVRTPDRGEERGRIAGDEDELLVRPGADDAETDGVDGSVDGGRRRGHQRPHERNRERDGARAHGGTSSVAATFPASYPPFSRERKDEFDLLPRPGYPAE